MAPPSRTALLVLAAALGLGLSACSDSSATGVTLQVHADAAFDLDFYKVKLDDRIGIVDADPTVTILAPDALSGQSVELEVWGLSGTAERAYGATSVTVRANEMRHYSIELEGLDCSDSCEDGAVRCEGDGLSTCVAGSGGCYGWGPAAACPSGTPFCSNGYCAATCVDECDADETACDGSLAEKTCGNFDNDSCLEWSSPVACDSAQMCNSDRCTAAGCDVTGCEAPPGPTCVSATHIQVSEQPSCEQDGTCSYATVDYECDQGCTGGKCNCHCGRAGECCRKIMGGDPTGQCYSWDASCTFGMGGSYELLLQVRAYVAMNCPEFTCY